MITKLKSLLRRKPKSYLLDGKYEIVPAFDWQGQTYYMHKDPLNTLAGRGLTSLVYMEELLMRCDTSYLKQHIEAVNKIFSDPKKIDLPQLFKLNSMLEERVNLLVAIPEHVYKLASVVFFTKDESPFKYDFHTGREKIEAWKAAPDMYSFFLQKPLKDLIPSLALPEQDSGAYLETVDKINELHLSSLQRLLSSAA